MSKLKPKDVNAPAILLGGPVDYDMYKEFRTQLDRAPKDGLVVTELSTLRGDPEVARMMGEDIRFHSDNSPSCRFVFLGKAAIYSAGTTSMKFFAVENRYLTRGTRLMIHERKLDKTLQISGPLTTCVSTVKATLHEIEASIVIQYEGFENLICGSQVMMDDVLSARRAIGTLRPMKQGLSDLWQTCFRTGLAGGRAGSAVGCERTCSHVSAFT